MRDRFTTVAGILLFGLASTTAIVLADILRIETRDCRHAGRTVLTCVAEVLKR